MRKRLRKKLRRGEFRELGFALGFRIRADAHLDAVDRFMDSFLTDGVEARGLAFLGGGREEWTGFVMAGGRGSVSEGQRAELLTWLRARRDVEAVRAGPLVDMWHSPEEAYEPPAP
jgi:hypothetical protein